MSIQRGKIYFVNLNPVQGKEQAGMRPVLEFIVDFYIFHGCVKGDQT